ncbi:putative bifunctional inhibitor/plant lipid transfer protein/seed storage helical [Medicago truncatula]|uniref:Putative bifunctional inhibitor/plant lipid transfer protein/seed storage helical n=1 Tax=Medicago truncatula TaxID=3880 RepID=A0A396JU52_MEDTR|nr:putative bifunctional inhibitor/plant lipid transfer protein/seed storage helical [Medicago truncatula]
MAGPVSMRCQVALVLVLVVALGTKMEMGEAQTTCPTQLSNLNVCAPFVVPGSPNTNPSPDCCTALQSTNPDCLCNTLRIASQLTSQCNLPSFGCGNFFIISLYIVLLASFFYLIEYNVYLS